MAITVETIHAAREHGENFMKLCNTFQNCIRETITKLGAMTRPEYDFVKERDSAVEHLELIIQTLSDAFYHNGKQFSDAYADLLNQVTSTDGCGPIDMDTLEDIEAYIPDDESYKNEILVPAYMIDHILNVEQSEDLSGLDWERHYPDFVIAGPSAKDVKLILLNTICTRDLLRENGEEDLLHDFTHCIGDYVSDINDQYPEVLHDIIEAVTSSEIQRMALGIAAGNDASVVKAGAQAMTSMTNALVGLANHVIYAMAYTKFYMSSIPAIVNDAQLISVAYSRYQLESAVHF